MKPVKALQYNILLIVPRRYFFCGSFVSCVSHTLASVHCCILVTCWEGADLLALVGDIYCIFVAFLCGILGQVWYLIVSFHGLFRLSYFVRPYWAVLFEITYK